jgi:hypothetical protein
VSDRLLGRLQNPEAVLTRSDLAELGYPRRAVDVIFKHIIREGGGVQLLPGFSRPLIRVGDFLEFRERCSHREDAANAQKKCVDVVASRSYA